MTIDEIINKIALFILFNHEGLESAGIKERKFYAKVVGRDSIGIWIENPKLETTRMRDDHGYIIPPEQRKHEDPDGLPAEQQQGGEGDDDRPRRVERTADGLEDRVIHDR